MRPTIFCNNLNRDPEVSESTKRKNIQRIVSKIRYKENDINDLDACNFIKGAVVKGS